MLKKIKSKFTIVSTIVIVVCLFSYYVLQSNDSSHYPSSRMKEPKQTLTSSEDTFSEIPVDRIIEKYQEYVKNDTLGLNQSGELSNLLNESHSSSRISDVPTPINTNSTNKVNVEAVSDKQFTDVSLNETLNITTLDKTGSTKLTITSDLYDPGFKVNNSHLCPNNGEHVQVVILITSAPGHSKHRDGIRYTWGHFSRRKDVVIAFILGDTNNVSLAEEIAQENSDYGDIIIGNFIDSYDNLTLKGVCAFEWIITFCNLSTFNLKTDDDVFINVPKLLEFISTHKDVNNSQPTIYGSLAKRWKPFRVKASKYYVSTEQFPGKIYPDFTTGPAYLYNPRIAYTLFHKALEKPYLKLEDVFLTGIVAGEANISRVDIYEFGSEKLKIRKTGFCKLIKLISIHEVSFYQQFELWKRMFDRQSYCNFNTASAFDISKLLLNVG